MNTRQTRPRLQRERRSSPSRLSRSTKGHAARGASRPSAAKAHRSPRRGPAKTTAPLRDFPPKSGGILLVGMCPGATAASSGHYFQGAFGRRIWKRLAQARLLPIAAPGRQDDAWVQAGHGLTSVVTRLVPTLGDLDAAEVERGAAVLRRKVREWSPRVVIFGFKMAAEAALAAKGLTPGPGPQLEGARTFLMGGPFQKPADAAREAEALAKL